VDPPGIAKIPVAVPARGCSHDLIMVDALACVESVAHSGAGASGFTR
jgi:hypothetical protein